MTACPTCGSELDAPEVVVVEPTVAAGMIDDLCAAGMSRRAVGRALYVSDTTVFNYARGYTVIPPDVEARLVELHAHLVAWDVAANREAAA